MKIIDIFLFVLLSFFLFKFSEQNLNYSSIFPKIGCNSDTKEYSLFLEAGCKNGETVQDNYNQVLNTDIELIAAEQIVQKMEWEAQFVAAIEEEVVIEEEAVVEVKPDALEEPPWFVAWIASNQPKSTEPPQPVVCNEGKFTFYPKRLAISHVWGDQENESLPFASNFTTVEVFSATDYCLGKMMPFIDLGGHRFDNNTYAVNGGVGARYVPDPATDRFCEILGFNVYYDYRQGCIGYYSQVGIGLEVLSDRWDFRANAYAPFGKKKHISRCVYDDYIGDYYLIRDTIESISYSFNAEIGCLLLDIGEQFYFYAAGGPYFLARAKYSDGVVGGEVRVRPQYKDYVAVDMSWRYDSLFQTIWQIELVFTLPLYQIVGKNERPCGIRDWQIYQPVERFEVMPLSKKTCWQSNF